MEHKESSRYPNFYIILNQSAGVMNEQQQNEVHFLRSKIIGIAPHMKAYISTNESDSMPLAFNKTTQESSSKALRELQQSNKTPTDEFYNHTKRLSALILKIIEERGKKRTEGRTLFTIYDEMERVWSTILKIPILTKYSNRKMKVFELSVSQWKQ